MPLGASRAGLMSVAADDIPDTVVSRPDDDSSNTTDLQNGVRIESDVVWEDEIGLRISANTDNATRAYVFRVSDGELIGESDISDLSAGDAFAVSLNDLIGDDDEEYNCVLDAEGNDYTSGNFSDSTYPYESDDGNLRIINAARGADDTIPNAANIVEVGNVGLD